MNQEQRTTNEAPHSDSLAAQWVQQWIAAAPKLQAIRDEELRRRGAPCSPSPTIDHFAASRSSGLRVYAKYPERHGMVIMQHWFLRRQMLELLELNKSTDRSSQAG